jgi:hypothetical protein
MANAQVTGANGAPATNPNSGVGTGLPGGNGQSALAVADVPGDLQNYAEARGGGGGSGDTSHATGPSVGGNGGLATSEAEVNAAGPGFMSAQALAIGGAGGGGGIISVGSTLQGDNGGHGAAATASAFAVRSGAGSDSTYAQAASTGGEGGSTYAANGGAGGVASGTTAHAFTGGNGTALANVTQTGGAGGSSQSGGFAGAGASSSLVNAVGGGSNGGTLSFLQRAYGGTGGSSGSAGSVAAAAGNATSSLTFDDLANAAQSALISCKAPHRRHPKNDPQQAMLRGLLTDPHGRPIVPTYAAKRNRHYAYYETRKDLARRDDPPASRFGQGQLERHLIVQLSALLEDEHALRRLSSVHEAGQMRGMFAAARLLANQLALQSMREPALRSLLISAQVQAERIDLVLKPGALALVAADPLNWSIPLPERKPFREGRLRIDAEHGDRVPDTNLVRLVAEAFEARQLILNNPELSINQVALKEGRCRKQLAKLLGVSWLSPRIVESIAAGTQPKAINRTLLLEAALPIDWSAQEAMLGFGA